MAWNISRSEKRIRQFLQSVPASVVTIETFDDRYARFRAGGPQALAMAGASKSLFKVSDREAVLVDGAHVYVQLTNYHSVLQDVIRQTEARHRRALQFLHLHYAACDRIIQEYGAQRVDFHGPRLHAVIADPPGAQNERLRVARAVAFAQAIARMVEMTGGLVLNGEFATGTRIGIDSGKAIAVDSGRGSEPEPLFLGQPANYAAKLAEGPETGIYLSARARQALALSIPFGEGRTEYNMRNAALSSMSGATLDDQRIRTLSANVAYDMRDLGTKADFVFHRHTPPLRTIDYVILSPSNSIHMELASIFADIDGFTKYVDACIAQGRASELVSNLHAIRLELAAVLKEDFDGRKVRFIGDCLHGVLAEGTSASTDMSGTVLRGVMCAAAMRSSFDLCRDILPNIHNLGIAIGVEIGPTPITRLGIRGEYSVRCATSSAVSTSEDLQGDCEGDETALGTQALKVATIDVRRRFDVHGKAKDLTYEDAVSSIEGARFPTPAVRTAAGTSAGWISQASSDHAIRSTGSNRHA